MSESKDIDGKNEEKNRIDISAVVEASIEVEGQGLYEVDIHIRREEKKGFGREGVHE